MSDDTLTCAECFHALSLKVEGLDEKVFVEKWLSFGLRELGTYFWSSIKKAGEDNETDQYGVMLAQSEDPSLSLSLRYLFTTL